MADDFDPMEHFSALSTEGFLKANATKENIIAGFVDILRAFLRAIASKQNNLSGIIPAEDVTLLFEQIQRCDERIPLHEFFAEAVNGLKSFEGYDPKDMEVIEAAQTGLLMLVEASCVDSAAKGRFAKRKRDFISQINHLETNQSSFVKETLSALSKAEK